MFICIGSSNCKICLRPIYDALGPLRVAALSGLHALSGADITGAFKGKSKISFWKKFLEFPPPTLEALSSLGKDEIIGDSIFEEIESFICAVYSSFKKNISGLSELRWWVFSQKQSLSDNMPPTLAALKPAIRRCHYQCMEWSRDTIAHPNLPPATDYGWQLVNGEFEPIMCDLPCAPDEVLNLVRCSCKKNSCTQRCKCATQSILCTKMGECGGV